MMKEAKKKFHFSKFLCGMISLITRLRLIFLSFLKGSETDYLFDEDDDLNTGDVALASEGMEGNIHFL